MLILNSVMPYMLYIVLDDILLKGSVTLARILENAWTCYLFTHTAFD